MDKSLHIDSSLTEILAQSDEESTNNKQNLIPLDQLLFRLTSDDDTLTPSALYAFSDLSRYNMQLIEEHWTDIPSERRRWVVSQLIDLAENEIDLHLGRVLRIAVADEDEYIRESAIAGLWEDLGSDLGNEYLRLLRKESSPNVRAAIAEALGNYVLAGELDEVDASLAMRAEDALLTLVHDIDEPLLVRSKALESIAYSSEAGVRQLIEDGYYSPDEEMRISALKSMGRSADIRWRNPVRAELENPSPLMRAEAARACGELGARNAATALLFLLQDDAPVVRKAAIFALGRIGGKDATEALQILAQDGPEDEQIAAQEALEDITFYADAEGVSLFDESILLDEDEPIDDWEKDPWDDWLGFGEEDLGIYED